MSPKCLVLIFHTDLSASKTGVPVRFEFDGYQFAGEVDTSVNIRDPDPLGSKLDVGECIDAFAWEVENHHLPAELVPVNFSMTVYQIYVRMGIQVTRLGTPPLTYDDLERLLYGNWPLYDMPEFDEHPFWFQVTNDAGVSLVLFLDRMPATRASISAGNVDIEATTYHENPLDRGDVESVLNQAIKLWSGSLNESVPTAYSKFFRKGDVTLALQGITAKDPDYTFRVLSETVQGVKRYFQTTGQWTAFWSLVSWRSPHHDLTGLDLWGGFQTPDEEIAVQRRAQISH